MNTPTCCGKEMSHVRTIKDSFKPEWHFQCKNCGMMQLVRGQEEGEISNLDPVLESTFEGLSPDNLTAIWLNLRDRQSMVDIPDDNSLEHQLYIAVTTRLLHLAGLLSVTGSEASAP